MRIRFTIFLYLRRYPALFKSVRWIRDHFPMALSTTIHLTAFILLSISFVEETKKEAVISTPIFMIDLEEVKVSETTNLAPKIIEEKKPKPKVEKKVVKTSVQSKAETSLSRGGQKKTPPKALKVSNDLDDLLKSLTKETSQKKKEEIKKEEKIKQEDPFKTLLASVDGIKKGLGHAQEPPEIKEEEMLTKGIEGGQGGSYMQELSVSEKDMIGIKLRACWNVDSGARGVQDMLIEIRVFLSKEGIVKDAKILNETRYNKDTAFRSVAESARRAVYVCDKKKEDSPFKLFAQNYEQTYDSWKTLLLRFNPLDGGVI